MCQSILVFSSYILTVSFISVKEKNEPPKNLHCFCAVSIKWWKLKRPDHLEHSIKTVFTALDIFLTASTHCGHS